MSAERFKNVTSLEIDDLLNNKTIILLNLAEYRLILADSAYGRLKSSRATAVRHGKACRAK